MPPTFGQQKHDKKHNTSSILTANSSANVSSATISNLTATTNLNQTSSSSHMGRDKQLCFSNESNSATDCDTSRNSRLLITVNPISEQEDNSKKTITTQTSKKFLSKRRNYKHKLNRETDIMLIVLSFSILVSQLPCALAWYLIYYRNVLQERTIYVSARTPIILFIIRLVEMVYFSLNFFFYITLSPTLRREIKGYFSGYDFLKKNFFGNNTTLFEPPSSDDKKSELQESKPKADSGKRSRLSKLIKKRVNNSPDTNNNRNNNSFLEFATSHNQINANSLLNINVGGESKRLSSNSSSEYFDFIHKLRSISPARKYPCLLTDECRLRPASSLPPPPEIQITQISDSETPKKTCSQIANIKIVVDEHDLEELLTISVNKKNNAEEEV